MPTLPYSSLLVTGATGFVGRYLLRKLESLLKPGAIVNCLDRKGSQPVDLLDAEAVRAFVLVAKPDLVVHLAAQSSVGNSTNSAADTWRINVGGTINLAEVIAKECPQATFAFSSSAEVYGGAFNSGRVDEATHPLPLSVYARTKLAAEEALADTLSSENRLIIFRPTNHSGAGQDERFVLPAFAKQIAAIEKGQISRAMRVGSLTAERDFLDVRDVVDAYIKILAVPTNDSRQIYNIASGRPIPIAHLLDLLLELSPASIKVEQDPALIRNSEVARTEVAIDRIHAITNWTPRYNLRDTVADVLRACRHSEV